MAKLEIRIQLHRDGKFEWAEEAYSFPLAQAVLGKMEARWVYLEFEEAKRKVENINGLKK